MKIKSLLRLILLGLPLASPFAGTPSPLPDPNNGSGSEGAGRALYSAASYLDGDWTATNRTVLEGFTYTSAGCDNLYLVPGLAPPATWWSSDGDAALLMFPAEDSVLGLFSDSCSCFDVSPSSSQAAGMTFAHETLDSTGASLHITVRGQVGGVPDFSWGQIVLTNSGPSIQVRGTLADNTSNLVVTLSLGGMVVGNVTNLASVQLDNSPTEVQVVGVGGDVGAKVPGMTVNFAGPIRMTGSSNQFDAITFRSMIPSSVDSITAFRFCGYELKPLQIICADTKVGPLKLEPFSPQGAVLVHPGNGDLSFAPSVNGPWTNLTDAASPLSLTANLKQQFFRKIDRSRRCCRLPMLFLNSAPLPNATTIRVLSGSASTTVYFASASAPNIVDGHYPSYVDFTLPSNTPFPSGNVPGNFDIWVKGSAATDKHVTVQWLDATGAVLCQQDVATPCPFGQDTFESSEPSEQTNTLSACSCMGSTLTIASEEEDTTESADVYAELGVPTQIGPRTWSIVNLSEIDPPESSVDTNLTVTVEDPATGVITVIQNAITVDAQGNIIVTLPRGHDVFSLNLEISSKPCNLDDEGDYDSDSAELRSTASAASFSYTPADCDAGTFTFTDTTVADWGYTLVSGSETWTIYDLDGSTILAQRTGSPVSYHFSTAPIGSQCYKVEMSVTETAPNPNGGLFTETLGPTSDCVTFTDQLTAGFSQTYLACPKPSTQFDVQFHNATTPPCSMTTYDWDFGDGSPHSTVAGPLHHYTSAGTYAVTLCAHRGAASDCKTVLVSVQPFSWNAISWSYEGCPDGAVSFMSSVGSHWEFPGGRVQGCDSSPCNCACSDEQTVKVCYPSGTTNMVTLWATNSEGGFCSTNFIVYPLDLGCCPKGHFKETYYYSYNGSSYQIKVQEKYNGKFWHSVVSKTKVKKANSKGKYRRKGARVYYVRAAYSGTLYASSVVSGCDCDLPFQVSGAVHHYNKRRATKHAVELYALLNFRHWDARLNSLQYVHEVQVDSSDPGWSFSHSLSEGACHTKPCN